MENLLLASKVFTYLVFFKIFSFSANPQNVMHPPVTEHWPIHNESLCKNMARSIGGFRLYVLTKLGSTNGKHLFFQSLCRFVKKLKCTTHFSRDSKINNYHFISFNFKLMC